VLARVRIHTVHRRDWRDYRDIRLAALHDAPSAFASTWQEEASLTAPEWMERAQRSEDGDTLTIVIAVDDAGRWAGLAGDCRPGDQGADAELISMWVAPDCRGHKIGPELVRAVLAWAESHRAGQGTPDEMVAARGLAVVSDEGALTATRGQADATRVRDLIQERLS
jgi:GNAT superfamily N-acetyltransferase